MIYTYHTITDLIGFKKDFDANQNLLYIEKHPLITQLSSLTCKYAHHIFESLDYAHLLLYLDEEKNLHQVHSIIKTVLRYQNLNKNSRFYGYWPYFSEESIEEMLMPDLGLNARLGISLFQIIQDYSHCLDKNLIKKMQDACILTTFTFISEYTEQNIINLTQYVYLSVACGEVYDKPEFVKYGEQIFQALYNRTVYHNGFFECNDLIFSIKFIRIASLLMHNTKNAICQDICGRLLDIIWGNLATHFHRPTMQIAGPFALADSDFMTSNLYDFFYGATNRKIDLPHSAKSYEEIAKCPIKYYPYFSGDKFTEFSQQVVSHGIAFPYFRFSLVSTTYLKPKYTVGSFNREEFWKSRRPFIGYFGNADNVYCFKLDILHDFFGFSSAALHSVQYHGSVLGHITMQTNRGDKHISVDSPNSKIEAKDFRFRFSIQGQIDRLEITHNRNSIKIVYEDVTLYYQATYENFDGYEIKYRFWEDENVLYFDGILHSGEKKTIDFEQMESAIFEFMFLITATNKMPQIPQHSFEKNLLMSSVTSDNICLELHTPVKPSLLEVNMNLDAQFINGVRLERYAIQTTEKLKNYTYLDKLNQQQPVKLPLPELTTGNVNLADRIESIQAQDLDNLKFIFNEIVALICDGDYSLILQKRLAVQIAVNIFECAKSNNHRFSDLIDKKHSNIFQKIIAAESFETICKNLDTLCDTILKDKALLENHDKNRLLMDSVVTLIRENLLNPDLSLKYIADQLGYSTAYISRIFIDSTDMNYITYVQQEKLNFAIEQLQKKRMSIKEVSEKIGYSNPSSFMRMFRQTTGMTIKEYLRANL